MSSEADPHAGGGGPTVDDERSAGTTGGGEPAGSAPDPTAAEAGPASDQEAAATDAAAAASGSGADEALEVDVELTPEERCRLVEDQLRRALADLDNVRKRFQREVVRERTAERARVAAMWLPIVDDLERALQHAGADPSTVLDGVRAVYDHAVAVLEQLGYPRYEDVGQLFDPARHEATTAIGSDLPRGTVLAVMRPGYGQDAEILRPAAVVVSRGSS
ncbi:MAG: grpE2 [Acidimicrobiales bacterium]|nr:grpE2 [Acidimicrobiales bacterium]